MIPDRIEAGTYLAVAAAAGNGVKIKNVIYEHLESFIAKLQEIGVSMKISEDEIEVYPSKEFKSRECDDLSVSRFCHRLTTTADTVIIDDNWNCWRSWIRSIRSE